MELLMELPAEIKGYTLYEVAPSSLDVDEYNM